MYLKLPAPDVSTDTVVAVDLVTGWMEFAALPMSAPEDMTMWIHNQVVCQYGPLMAMQIDHGIEFKGDFDRYLRI